MAIVFKNKRHGADGLERGKNFIVILAWCFLFAMFVLYSMAKPDSLSMFDKVYKTGAYSGLWDKSLLRLALLLMFPLGTFSAIGLMLNSKHHKRKRDSYSKTLIVSLILSIIGVAFYFILFM